MLTCVPIINPNLTAFERKYMFLEADTDDRANVRRISINSESGRRKISINGRDADTVDIDLDEDDLSEEDIEGMDDSDIDIEDDIDTEEDMDEEDISLEEEPTGDSEDVETEPVDTEPSEDDSPVEEEPSGDESEGTTEEEPSTGGEEESDVDIEGDDSDDSGDSSEEQPDTGESEENSDGEEASPEDKEEIIHKHTLFNKFERLYETITNYISTLDGVVGKTYEINHQYKLVKDELKRLVDFLYDYMIIRFKDATYAESMLFYQRAIAAVNLSLDMLTTIRKKEEK